MKDDRVYMRHIVECIDAIRAYTADGRRAFQQDRKTRKATLRELQELAESTQRLSAPLKARHPEIPWADIAGFRNVLVHDYLGLNLDRILVCHRARCGASPRRRRDDAGQSRPGAGVRVRTS